MGVVEGEGSELGNGVESGDEDGIELGVALSLGLGAGVEVGSGVGKGGDIGIEEPHSPASLTIAPLLIFTQYGSFVTSSKSVIPAGVSWDPTVSFCAIISLVIIFTAMIVPSSSIDHLPR